MVNWLLPLAVLVATWLADAWHAARVRRIRFLAFGPPGQPRAWVAAARPLRAASMAAAAWGLLVLWQISASEQPATEAHANSQSGEQHLVVALDVSPSMTLVDAGPHRELSRAQRARDVLRSVLDRIDARRTKISIVAFYSEARPVVIDTFDADVVANILSDLPLEQAFTTGKTNLYEGLKAAGQLAKGWQPKSATLLLVSDGDTLPTSTPPALPAAFAQALVLGIGNPNHGAFIDGHNSRQNVSELRRLAKLVGGTYFDATSHHVASTGLERLLAPPADELRKPLDLRQLAIAATLTGAAGLALLPALLALFGRAWSSRRARPVSAIRLRHELVGGGTAT